MPEPLRLSAGHHHFDHRAAPFVALTHGWFGAEAAGPVSVAASGADDHTVAALYAGSVDIGLDISPAKVLHDHLAGGDLVIVGAMANGVGQVLTSVPGITSVADLRGRRIHVVEKGTGVDWHPLRILLRRHGIDPDRDVTLVYGAPYPLFQNADRAFRDGIADARMLLHAEAPKLRAAGYPVLFDFLAEYPVDYPQRCIVTTRRFVAQQGDRLVAFLRAMIRGYRFLRDEAVYHQAMAIVREHMGDDPGLGFPPGITDHFLGSHYFGFKQMPPDGGVSETSLQRYIDEEALEGRIPPGLRAGQVHDGAPAAAALQSIAARFGTGYGPVP
jgi:ABC-type nitrate/sulfonate/bicarbonate transport system substrate-binding protein